MAKPYSLSLDIAGGKIGRYTGMEGTFNTLPEKTEKRKTKNIMERRHYDRLD